MAPIVGTNSYLSVVDASALIQEWAGSSDWDAAETFQQEEALVTATLILDENRWIGSAVSTSQKLGWPRTGVRFVDPKLNLVIAPAIDEIPERVKLATALLAFHFIQHPNAYSSSESVAENISVGPISISDSNSKTKTVRTPSIVLDQIKPLIVSGSSLNLWWRAN